MDLGEMRVEQAKQIKVVERKKEILIFMVSESGALYLNIFDPEKMKSKWGRLPLPAKVEL